MERLQPGDACVECSSRGVNHKLRYFYINLNEQLLKCESRRCLWPHTDAVSSSSSSDDEQETIRSPKHSLNLDDDEFIKQLLENLTPSTEIAEASTKANNSKCDSSLTPNVPSSSNAIMDLLEESHPPATTTAPVISMPNIFGEFEQQPEQTAFNLEPVNAPPFQLSTKAGNFATSISQELPTPKIPLEKELPTPMIPLEKELPTPMIPLEKELPKASTFQTPPRKASTLPRSELHSKPMPPTAPTTNASSSTAASQFLNALKAQPVQGARTKRTRQLPRPESSSGGGSPRFSTQDIKQTLERISKQK
ncbi:PREDICTED: fibronectin-binding protein A-like isoform X1 [Drosophila arizonae]|uniref:Fibronectin-binding protein A-like isoform X1 n=1 Tax=Drosophila arizonae TaxID=7263 RepID=A0ABM1PKC2_DROAR|nr:PREDICTED: fibronectin-binding protein A-like isoform X1 [Drosophila arizonae]